MTVRQCAEIRGREEEGEGERGVFEKQKELREVNW